MFTLAIKTGNAAYDDGNCEYELIRNLKEIIKKLEYGYDSGSVMDINGNKVGSWELTK